MKKTGKRKTMFLYVFLVQWLPYFIVASACRFTTYWNMVKAGAYKDYQCAVEAVMKYGPSIDITD